MVAFSIALGKVPTSLADVASFSRTGLGGSASLDYRYWNKVYCLMLQSCLHNSFVPLAHF